MTTAESSSVMSSPCARYGQQHSTMRVLRMKGVVVNEELEQEEEEQEEQEEEWNEMCLMQLLVQGRSEEVAPNENERKMHEAALNPLRRAHRRLKERRQEQEDFMREIDWLRKHTQQREQEAMITDEDTLLLHLQSQLQHQLSFQTALGLKMTQQEEKADRRLTQLVQQKLSLLFQLKQEQEEHTSKWTELLLWIFFSFVWAVACVFLLELPSLLHRSPDAIPYI